MDRQMAAHRAEAHAQAPARRHGRDAVGGFEAGLRSGATMTDVTERRKATMDIKRNGSRPSGKGPEAYFTGTVRVDPCFRSATRHASAAVTSPSSRARGPRGIRIRSARP